MTITPELAREWLERGGTNRKITRRRIEAMAAAIQRGEWQLTGEAIKLDHEGRVRDGQNRLHAVVEAASPFDRSSHAASARTPSTSWILADRGMLPTSFTSTAIRRRTRWPPRRAG